MPATTISLQDLDLSEEDGVQFRVEHLPSQLHDVQLYACGYHNSKLYDYMPHGYVPEEDFTPELFADFRAKALAAFKRLKSTP